MQPSESSSSQPLGTGLFSLVDPLEAQKQDPALQKASQAKTHPPDSMLFSLDRSRGNITVDIATPENHILMSDLLDNRDHFVKEITKKDPNLLNKIDTEDLYVNIDKEKGDRKDVFRIKKIDTFTLDFEDHRDQQKTN